MSNNPKLLGILGTIAFVLIVGFIWSSMGSSNNSSSSSSSSNKKQSVYDVASGDTNNEVLKKIIAHQKSLEKKNKQLAKANKKLRNKNSKQTQQQLKQTVASLHKKIHNVRDKIEHEMRSNIKQIKNTHKEQKRQSKSSSNLEYHITGSTNQSSRNKGQAIHHVPDLSQSMGPQDKSNQSNVGSTYHPKSDNSNKGQSQAPSLPSDNQDQSKSKIPKYTIPDGSTIGNAVLLSPLIAEVPKDGKLNSPAFHFKAMLNYKDTKDMLAANNVPLPSGLAGTILQGYSVGNMTMGCARAYVMKILFVFKDGHYVVYPKDKNNSNSAKDVYPKNAIGYISNAYNNPCIKGQYHTDAPKVIASLASMGALSGAGGAIAKSQTENVSNIQQGTSGSVFTGNLAKYAGGLAVGQGSSEALDWYKSRIKNINDIVYVPSTKHHKPRRFIFNVTRTIKIDLNQKGRKLSYDQENQSHTDHSLR